MKPIINMTCLAIVASASAVSAQNMSLEPVGGAGNEITIRPGDTVTIRVFIDDATGELVRGYQVTLPTSGSGGASGSLDHDGLAPSVDDGLGNYIFSGLDDAPTGVALPAPRFANATQDALDAVDASTAKYAADFDFTASDDASGTFTVDVVAPGSNPSADQSFIVNQDNQARAFSTAGAIIHIAPTMSILPQGGVGNTITVSPGDSVTVDVFVQAAAPELFRGAQATLPVSASGGSGGSVTHDGALPVIDGARVDNVFFGIDDAPSVDAGPPPRLANAAQDPQDSVSLTGRRYLGEFTYSVSNDAAGDFTLSIVDPGTDTLNDASFMTDDNNAALDLMVIDAVISVAAGCTTSDDCIDNSVCTFDDCIAGACVNTPGLHGDIATSANECGQDNDLGLFDLFTMLDALSGTGICTDAQADIAGQAPAPACEPDNDIGLFDIFAMLDAFNNTPGCSCP